MRKHSMRSLVLLAAIVLAIPGADCSSGRQQLVGTWKGDIIPPAEAKSSSDGKDGLGNMLKGFLSALIGPMTIEFNSDGKYKVSVAMASETGTYSINGNEVTLTPDDKDDKRRNKVDIGTLVLANDGKSLHAKKEFKSDSDFVLKKQE